MLKRSADGLCLKELFAREDREQVTDLVKKAFRTSSASQLVGCGLRRPVFQQMEVVVSVLPCLQQDNVTPVCAVVLGPCPIFNKEDARGRCAARPSLEEGRGAAKTFQSTSQMMMLSPSVLDSCGNSQLPLSSAAGQGTSKARGSSRALVARSTYLPRRARTAPLLGLLPSSTPRGESIAGAVSDHSSLQEDSNRAAPEEPIYRAGSPTLPQPVIDNTSRGRSFDDGLGAALNLPGQLDRQESSQSHASDLSFRLSSSRKGSGSSENVGLPDAQPLADPSEGSDSPQPRSPNLQPQANASSEVEVQTEPYQVEECLKCKSLARPPLAPEAYSREFAFAMARMQRQASKERASKDRRFPLNGLWTLIAAHRRGKYPGLDRLKITGTLCKDFRGHSWPLEIKGEKVMMLDSELALEGENLLHRLAEGQDFVYVRGDAGVDWSEQTARSGSQSHPRRISALQANAIMRRCSSAGSSG